MRAGSTLTLENKRITYASIAQIDSAIFTLVSMRMNLASAAATTFGQLAPPPPDTPPTSIAVFAVVAAETTAFPYMVPPTTPLADLLHWIAIDAGTSAQSRRFFHSGSELLPSCTAPLSALGIDDNSTIYVV